MTDKELGDALLKLELAPGKAPTEADARRIIDLDQRRLKWLTRATIGLWALAAVGALVIFIVGGLVVPLIAQKREQDQKLHQPANEPFVLLAKLTAANVALSSLSTAVLVVAGLATVLLVFRTRRATLRQINANLLQISEQLKQQRR